MTIDSRVMTLQEVDDITRRALSACGASGQQLELAPHIKSDGGIKK